MRADLADCSLGLGDQAVGRGDVRHGGRHGGEPGLQSAEGGEGGNVVAGREDPFAGRQMQVVQGSRGITFGETIEQSQLDARQRCSDTSHNQNLSVTVEVSARRDQGR